MGYDSLMINGDERIEVRGMRIPHAGSGPAGSRRGHRRENVERDTIDLLLTDMRTANASWAPDGNA
jgi:hypothetical protein